MITSIDTIKKQAATAAISWAKHWQANPYPQGSVQHDLFKKHFELERMFLDQETAQEKPITDAISTGAGIDIQHSLNQFTPAPHATTTASGQAK
jgi:hypothetical protein